MVDLQRSEERFRSLVRNASDGVVVLGPDGQMKYESPAVERILGRSPDATIGQPAMSNIHPDDRAAVERRFADVAAASGSEAGLEFRVRHADGSWRILEAIAKNLLDDAAVGGVVVNFRDITERKALEEQLRHQAFHDVLTGLANRSLFRDRLGHALARASRGALPTAVLYLDIDDFKAVNDRLGHGEGDRLLVMVGERLVAATRAGDTVARLGGDEFAVIVEETDPAEASRAAERILRALAQPFELGDGRRASGRASVSRSATSTEAMPTSCSGVPTSRCTPPRRGVATVTRSTRPDSMRRPLRGWNRRPICRARSQRGELRVAYQPIVDMESGAILGAEALMRWEHPERGPIPPSDFIPLAEESGLIIELGRWILETACRQTREWQEATGRSDLTISVNLSGRQIADVGLVADVARSARHDRARTVLPHTRDHRDDPRPRRRHDDRGIPRAQGPRCPSCYRRLRDRLLVAELPPPIPDRHPEDRSLLRRQSRRGQRIRARSCALSSTSAPRCGSTRWRRASRRREQRHALESLGATRGQATCSRDRWPPTEMGGLLANGTTTAPTAVDRQPRHVDRQLATPPPPSLRPAALHRPLHSPRGPVMTSTADTPVRSAPSLRLLVARHRRVSGHSRRRP